MRSNILTLMLIAVVAMAGCSKPAEAPSAPKPTTPDAAPKPTSTPAPAPTPTPAPAPAAAAKPSVKLPEEFTKSFYVNPEMTITSAETVDAAKAQYKIVGELRSSAKDVMDYYVKYFKEHGWDEDAVMEQKGMTQVSYKKNGLLEYIDTHEGGLGAIVTITTGRE